MFAIECSAIGMIFGIDVGAGAFIVEVKAELVLIKSK